MSTQACYPRMTSCFPLNSNGSPCLFPLTDRSLSTFITSRNRLISAHGSRNIPADGILAGRVLRCPQHHIEVIGNTQVCVHRRSTHGDPSNPIQSLLRGPYTSELQPLPTFLVSLIEATEDQTPQRASQDTSQPAAFWLADTPLPEGCWRMALGQPNQDFQDCHDPSGLPSKKSCLGDTKRLQPCTRAHTHAAPKSKARRKKPCVCSV